MYMQLYTVKCSFYYFHTFFDKGYMQHCQEKYVYDRRRGIYIYILQCYSSFILIFMKSQIRHLTIDFILKKTPCLALSSVTVRFVMQYVVSVKLCNVNHDFIYNVMYLIHSPFQCIKKKYKKKKKMDTCFCKCNTQSFLRNTHVCP